MSEKVSRTKEPKMYAVATDADRMEELVKKIGVRLVDNEKLLSRQYRVSRRLTEKISELYPTEFKKNPDRWSVTFRTVKAYWNKERAKIPHHHMEAAEALKRAPAVKAARNDLKEVKQQINRLKAAQAVGDSDHYSPQIAALSAMVRLATLIAPWVEEDQG